MIDLEARVRAALQEAPMGGGMNMDPVAVARARVAAQGRRPKALRRGGTGNVTTAADFNAKHPRTAKGRVGGGQFSRKQQQQAAQNLDASDPQTIRHFQRTHGLAVDGVIGPQTQAAMRQAGVSGKQPGGGRQPFQLGSRAAAEKAVRQEVQGAKDKGSTLNTGDKSAVERFQRQHGLAVDGVAGPKTLDTMRRAGVKDSSTGSTPTQTAIRGTSSTSSGGSTSRSSGGSSGGSSTSSSGGSSGSRSGGSSTSSSSSRRRSGVTQGPVSWQGSLSAVGVLRSGDGMNGARGDREVKLLQTKLEALGYDLGSAGVDGKFGPATAKALKAMQDDYGLKADGIAGRHTKLVLNLLGHRQQLRKAGGLSLDQQRLSIA